MQPDEIDAAIEEATLAFTLGAFREAENQLMAVLAADPDRFAAWHALTEVRFAEKRYDAALEAAQAAFALDGKDVHINTSLSRIWMEKGDKAQAEHFGARARMLAWKAQIAEQEGDTPQA
ncbi:MAG: tetratricopeptide repeat protein [Opitutales bacterium]